MGSKLTDKEVRERIVSRGAEALTDAELLSIVMQEGTASERTMEVAEEVLREAQGGLSSLAVMDLRKLRMLGGMGVKRAVRLSAALELGRRLNAEQSTTPATINTNDDVIAIFRPMVAHLGYEEFWVLYLSAANTVLDKARVSQGGVSGTMVDCKLVIKRALELLASSIILIHNHPSGVASPSIEDKKMTERVVQAAGLFDIAVLDHLVITSGECFSFRQEGFL